MANARRGKKGSIQDLLLMSIVLVIFTVLLLVFFRVQNELNERFQASPLFDSHGKESFQKVTNFYPGILDNGVLFLTVGLAVAAFILASLVRINPLFFAPFIIILVIIIFLAGVFSNVYQAVEAADGMGELAARLTFTNLIMNTLPFIVGVFGSVLAMVMYKAWRNS